MDQKPLLFKSFALAAAVLFFATSHPLDAWAAEKTRKDNPAQLHSVKEPAAAANPGATGLPPAPVPAQAQAKTPRQANKSDYIIGIEDVLEISIWRNPDLSKIVAVRPDGMISLPLLGDIKAAGLSPVELRDQIVSRLKEYQENVVASVIVQEVKSYRIFVLGEVLNPGTYLMMRKTTVLQAIALAGGFNQFASKNKMVLIREGVDEKKPERVNIRFDDIVYDEKAEKNLTLRPGDTIFVP